MPSFALNRTVVQKVEQYGLDFALRMLDEAASVAGTKGIMPTFDDFVVGMDQFGQRIQPLMSSRAHSSAAA
jgi:hypothetical protein